MPMATCPRCLGAAEIFRSHDLPAHIAGFMMWMPPSLRDQCENPQPSENPGGVDCPDFRKAAMKALQSDRPHAQ